MARDNAAVVRQLWEVFLSEGPRRALELVPDDVEWRPRVADGRTLLGSGDLRVFMAEMAERGERVEAELATVEDLGEHAVVATGRLRHTRSDGVAEEELVWLYCFRDGRLWRVSAHASIEEARDAARFTAADGLAPMRPADLDARRDGDVVRLRGELDLATVERVSAATGEVEPGGRLRIDFSELSFIDSSGLREILRLARDAEERGWTLELVPGPPPVHRVFELAGIDRALPFV